MSPHDMDDAAIEGLVRQVSEGVEIAWQKFWRVVDPALARLVAQPRFLGPFGQREDDRRNIVVEVMARLRADSFHRLKLYLMAREQNPHLTFMTWLRVVAKRVGIDCLRAHPEYVDKRRSADPSRPGTWMHPGTLPSATRLPASRPPVTGRSTAHEMFRHAATALPELQHRALELWIQSETYRDIAEALGLGDPAEAERVVRAAIERLRRHFRDEDAGGTP
jgi:DNA-directed RNA polymerase specialized sigma24 family protein